MKVEIECLPCIIHRGYLEIVEATKDPTIQFKAASKLLQYLAKEFKPDANAAILGTNRDRIIKRITGVSDIYAKKKQISNKIALELFPSFKEIVEKENTLEDRFRKACLVSIVGNVIEFDIPKHNVNLNNLMQLFNDAEKDLVVDEINEIFKEVKKAKNILFLCDNAGEIALDKLLIKELKNLGAKVTAAVKSGPILNDATLHDAKIVSMYEVADKIITTGTDAVGIPIKEEQSKEFTKIYNESDYVIAKGMGNAETITEIKLRQPHALLLRTKCTPVANYFRVSRGKNVAKLLRP